MSKPDLSQYPEIPQGCLINENKTFGLFQIYRNISIKDPITGKVKHTRETIGSIKNGIFTFSKTYLLAEQNRELSSKIDSMSAVNQVTLETNSQKSCERHLRIMMIKRLNYQLRIESVKSLMKR